MPRIKAFCFRCRANRNMKNPKQELMKNGRFVIKGKCPFCGKNIYRMGEIKK